nr:hypothetical protein [Tanacetum cinerariifolium]
NAVQNQGIQNVGNQNGLSVVPGIANQHGNGNVVAARAEGNSNGINGNLIRCYNCQGEDHYASNCTVKPRQHDAAYLQKQIHIAQKEEAWIQLTSKQASTSGTQSDKAPVYDTDGSTKRVVKQKTTLDIHNWSSSSHQEIHKIVKDEIFPIVNQVDARVQNFKIQFLKEAAKFFRDFKSLAKEADESLAKHKALELEIERLLRAVTKLHDTIYENAKLRAQLFDKVFEHNDTTRGTSANIKFAKQSILEKPPSSSRPKLYAVTPLPKSKAFPKVGEMHALLKPVTSNSVPTLTVAKVMKNGKHDFLRNL